MCLPCTFVPGPLRICQASQLLCTVLSKCLPCVKASGTAIAFERYSGFATGLQQCPLHPMLLWTAMAC